MGELEVDEEAVRRDPRVHAGPLADGLAHDEVQIEGADADQHPFEDVVTVAKMDAAQCSGLQTVSEGPFQEFPAAALQALASLTSDVATIGVGGQLRFTLVLPTKPATIGFGHVAANTFSLQERHRDVAVISPVQNHLSDVVGL